MSAARSWRRRRSRDARRPSPDSIGRSVFAPRRSALPIVDQPPSVSSTGAWHMTRSASPWSSATTLRARVGCCASQATSSRTVRSNSSHTFNSRVCAACPRRARPFSMRSGAPCPATAFSRLPETIDSRRQSRRMACASVAPRAAVSIARSVAMSAVTLRGVYRAATDSPSACAAGSCPNRSTNCQYAMPRGSSRRVRSSSSWSTGSMRRARPSRAHTPQRKAFLLGTGASRSQRNASTTTGARQVAQREPYSSRIATRCGVPMSALSATRSNAERISSEDGAFATTPRAHSPSGSRERATPRRRARSDASAADQGCASGSRTMPRSGE